MSFADEISEILADIGEESQYSQAFVQDPEVLAWANEFIRVGMESSISAATADGRTSQDGALDGVLLLVTYGFFLGREHARRGFPSPVPASNDVGITAPDDISSLD